MNAQESNTKFSFLQAYRLARLAANCSDNARSLAHRHTRYIAMNALYVSALNALANRRSHSAALMNRPVPQHNADWLVNFRCSRYAATSGRLPA
jgi:transposase InsO family protein